MAVTPGRWQTPPFPVNVPLVLQFTTLLPSEKRGPGPAVLAADPLAPSCSFLLFTASAVLGPHVATNPEASVSSFSAQPFPPAAAGPSHWSPWGQHSPPHVTPPFPPGSPAVLPTFPRTPLVAGDGGHGSAGTVACNVIVQVRSERGPAESPQTQTIVPTQAPAHWSAPGSLCGGAGCPAPLFLATAAVETSMSTPAAGGTWAGKGGSTPGVRPQAPGRAVLLSPIVPLVTVGQQPHAAPWRGSPAGGPTKAAPEDCCSPRSVYENFRRWQRFKDLARSYLPHSPDTEALSCFLM